MEVHTETERGRRESRALTVRRLGLGDLEPKLPKTTVSAHGPDDLITLAILEQCSGHTIGHTTHGRDWTVLVS